MEICLTIEDAGIKPREDEVNRLLNVLRCAGQTNGFKITCCDLVVPAELVPPRPVNERQKRCEGGACGWKYRPETLETLQAEWDRVYGAVEIAR